MSARDPKPVLVTGGAGFIGNAFVELALKHGPVICLDAMTYAGHPANLRHFESNPKFTFVQGNICDKSLVDSLLREYRPGAIVNFAAESHVDNSISSPGSFVQTNIVGVYNLLECSTSYWRTIDSVVRQEFRFLHVSTDEVFGQLGPEDAPFTEDSPYQPNSPYSASKASGDMLVRAWHHTYGLPVLTTNCSNNYGPRQFPEKLIPRMISTCLREMKLPVYGSGSNVRDWIHVDDHVNGVWLALTGGKPGSTYCFGGASERTNLQVVHQICDQLDRKSPRKQGSYKELIEFVTDRPGHDFRYAIDDRKAQSELGFKRRHGKFEDGLAATVDWYLSNADWLREVSGPR